MPKGTYQRRSPHRESVASWIDAARNDLIGVRDVLAEAEVPPAQAAGMAFWLADLGRGSEHVDRATRMRYARLLAELGPPPTTIGGPGSRNRVTPPLLSLSAA